jgi:predicted kinase
MFKKLIVLVRGIPCKQRTEFINKFGQEDVLAPVFIKEKTQGAAFVRKATPVQEEMLKTSFVARCQTGQILTIVNHDLVDQEDLRFYLEIAQNYGYKTQIVTFRPQRPAKDRADNVRNGSGLHEYRGRTVDFKSATEKLRKQKRLPNEKWVEIPLDPNYWPLES